MTSRKARLVVATLGLLLLTSAALQAQQVDPRGIPQPRKNPIDTRMHPEPRSDNVATYRRLIAEQIKKDFQKLQTVNDELGQLLATNPLDYKQIADDASRIKSLISRLDSNLVLGKAEGKLEARTEPEISDPSLKALVLTLHDLVVGFVENPIFHERGVLDITETSKAKSDVVEIELLSEKVRKVAKQLRKNVSS